MSTHKSKAKPKKMSPEKKIEMLRQMVLLGLRGTRGYLGVLDGRINAQAMAHQELRERVDAMKPAVGQRPSDVAVSKADGTVELDEFEQVLCRVAVGRASGKIEAIKRMRNRAGIGLKECKRSCDVYMATLKGQ